MLERALSLVLILVKHLLKALFICQTVVCGKVLECFEVNFWGIRIYGLIYLVLSTVIQYCEVALYLIYIDSLIWIINYDQRFGDAAVRFR